VSRLAKGLHRGQDGVVRCWWCGDDPLYQAYHDAEWGLPVDDERRLFEKLCLEGFQAGLSWITILRKRPAFRRAFRDFAVDRVARFDERSVQRLLKDAGIVRHRGKIEAAINNARLAKQLRTEGGLARLVWNHEPTGRARPKRLTHGALMKLTQTDASRALSKELKRRGWRFVGPTTVYAFMQSMGLVNDHVEGCAMRPSVEAARGAFARPS
jgi:DNA-3-methyladenine glycosylase I